MVRLLVRNKLKDARVAWARTPISGSKQASNLAETDDRQARQRAGSHVLGDENSNETLPQCARRLFEKADL